jgi:hypothetical protein
MTKNDPEAGGVHRSFTCALLERVEGNRVTLSGSKDQIRSRLTEEHEDNRGQERSQSSGGGIMGALFGSSDSDSSRSTSTSTSTQGQSTNQGGGNGPHVLDRSFSGTYDDDSATRK